MFSIQQYQPNLKIRRYPTKYVYITFILLTSQESFCPLAYPAQRKDSKITLVCPAVLNISWHTGFSIIGTWTSWRTEGTPPPYFNRPQPVTVASRPVKSSSSFGKQIGTGKVIEISNWMNVVI